MKVNILLIIFLTFLCHHAGAVDHIRFTASEQLFPLELIGISMSMYCVSTIAFSIIQSTNTTSLPLIGPDRSRTICSDRVLVLMPRVAAPYRHLAAGACGIDNALQ